MKKKILMAIAFKDFRDEEYFIPKCIFEDSGFTVKTVSTERGTAVGVHGGEAEIDFILEESDIKDYDAILLVGGGGALKHLDNEKVYKIIGNAYEKRVLIGAICIAPVILVKAGVLKNKRATVWTASMERSLQKMLEESGVVYEEKSVVCDGNIITANGPEAAGEFAEEIVAFLKKKM